MEETESQIAKIQLGSPKQTGSFVFVMAEKAQGSETELFLIAELPLPATETVEACENICLAMAAAFRRVYKRPEGGNNFENAISEINEELGKLASLGQTQWINKIHAIVAAKYQNTFYISSCGKVAAFLLRNGEFTDISCSGQTAHPLKTFDTFASGKIRLNDLLILSTTQLFNYLSMDRFKDLALSGNFLRATQVIIQLIKDNAGANIAFGTILNLQVPLGQTNDEEVDLESFIIEPDEDETGFKQKIFTWLSWLKHAVSFSKVPRVPKVSLPQIGNGLKNLGSAAKSAASAGKTAFGAAKKGFEAGKNILSWEKVKNYSSQKKFFFASVAVLLAVLIANISLAVHYRNIKKSDQQILANIQEAKNLLSKTSDSLLYKNDEAARNFFQTAISKLPKEGSKISSQSKAEYEQLKPLLDELKQKMEKALNLSVENLGSLSAGQVLLRLPGALGTENSGNITSFNLADKKILDGAFKSPGTILGAVTMDAGKIAVVMPTGLSLWSTAENKTSPALNQNIPSAKDFAGISFYPDNKKVYVADKSEGKIFSFVSGASGFSKPSLAVADDKLKNAQSLTIDGSIYALTNDSVLKYTKSVLQDFKLPFLLEPFSGEGKIYSQKDFNNIYILDISQKRIIILGLKGELIGTIKNTAFTDLKDFAVDEKAKTIYVLNGVSLLKLTLP